MRRCRRSAPRRDVGAVDAQERAVGPATPLELTASKTGAVLTIAEQQPTVSDASTGPGRRASCRAAPATPSAVVVAETCRQTAKAGRRTRSRAPAGAQRVVRGAMRGAGAGGPAAGSGASDADRAVSPVGQKTVLAGEREVRPGSGESTRRPPDSVCSTTSPFVPPPAAGHAETSVARPSSSPWTIST
jgi:hypothetical protein